MSESKSITTTADDSGEQPESEPISERDIQPTVTSGKASLTLALLALGISIGLAVAAYFIWNEVQRLSGTQSGVATQVEDRIQPLRSTLSDVSKNLQASLNAVNQTLQSERHHIEQRLESERQQIDQRLHKLSEQQRSVAHQVRMLADLIGRSEQGWSLAEVEYLLRIANQRLQLQGDVKTAAQALKAADQRLQELADPHFLSVREQIARDLESLKAVPSIDVEGISLSLTAALTSIDQLAVEGSRYQPPATIDSKGEAAGATISDWRELPRLLWSSLSGLFRIREHDKPVTPMLAPEREYFLRENLRLQLSAARLALLRDDDVQYRAILTTAGDWLNAYFDDEDAGVATLPVEIERLKVLDTVPQLPDISASLRLLHQQMKVSEQRAVSPPAADQPIPAAMEQAAEEKHEQSEEDPAP
jgi:uroporphyrin-3 C-methyltransferase